MLRGRITIYTNSVFGFTDAKRANEYRVTISISVTYKDLVKNHPPDHHKAQSRIHAARSRIFPVLLHSVM